MTVARGGFACPKCGKPNDAATPVGDDPAAVPVPGDVLVCIGCATPAIVTADYTLELAGRDVLDIPDVALAIALILGYRDQPGAEL